MGYIYKITNTINNKLYIGKTIKTIQERWNEHIKKAKEHPNRYLYDAINHYGIDNFTIEQIEECDNEILNEREIYWISYYNTYYLSDNSKGYNMTLGGEGGNTWEANPHKEETSRKLSQALTGKHKSEECKQYLSALKKGKHFHIIDEEAMFADIKNGMSISDLINKYHISEWTIRFRCKEKFGCSYGQLREVPVQRRQYQLSEKALQERKGRFAGEKNGAYKKLPIQEFYNDIIHYLTIEELCKKYNISKPTLYKKCQEYFQKSLRELRKESQYVK